MVTGNKSDLTVGMNYTFNGKQERGRLYGIKALLKPGITDDCAVLLWKIKKSRVYFDNNF